MKAIILPNPILQLDRAEAVVTFGRLVKITLLADFADEDQAMLLYDMNVGRLGKLRVAEHFPVADGRN